MSSTSSEPEIENNEEDWEEWEEDESDPIKSLFSGDTFQTTEEALDFDAKHYGFELLQYVKKVLQSPCTSHESDAMHFNLHAC
jgi:hypothetical protein